MGKALPGSERRSFVGKSEADESGPATLDEALFSAAEEAVNKRFVRPLVEGEEGPDGGPIWFDLAGIQVEIANQHIKTMRVIVTER